MVRAEERSRSSPESCCRAEEAWELSSLPGLCSSAGVEQLPLTESSKDVDPPLQGRLELKGT